jgi:3'(2'), 5'-bisphosphate nucleotidase
MGLPTDPVLSATIDHGTVARLMAPLTELVALAGAAILKVDRTRMRIDGKADGSPVTEADLAADRIIAEGLARLAPDIPALSEERVAPGSGGCPKDCPSVFFLIDPLDGTKEFVAGRNEFTVNLALVADGMPLLGIIGAPALGLIWRGLVGQGAERLVVTNSGTGHGVGHGIGHGIGLGIGLAQPIRTRPFPPPGKPWIAAVSRSHGDAATEAFIDARPGAVRERLGSAVKLAKVAEGTVDIYPRLAPTSEWDIAAGHAIVTAAGGKVTDAAGGELRFGQGFQQGFGKGAKDFIVPAFIAWGDPTAA